MLANCGPAEALVVYRNLLIKVSKCFEGSADVLPAVVMEEEESDLRWRRFSDRYP
jgi:hypothetical protein